MSNDTRRVRGRALKYGEPLVLKAVRVPSSLVHRCPEGKAFSEWVVAALRAYEDSGVVRGEAGVELHGASASISRSVAPAPEHVHDYGNRSTVTGLARCSCGAVRA